MRPDKGVYPASISVPLIARLVPAAVVLGRLMPGVILFSMTPETKNSGIFLAVAAASAHFISIVMEIAIQKLVIVSCFVIGLSHIFQPRVWAQFFIDMRNKGETGSFINAFIHFPLGALIVAFHNVWQGIPLIVTLIGYAWVLKGLIYFVFPGFGLKVMSRVSLDKSWEFGIAGIMLLGLGGLLLFSIISKP